MKQLIQRWAGIGLMAVSVLTVSGMLMLPLGETPGFIRRPAAHLDGGWRRGQTGATSVSQGQMSERRRHELIIRLAGAGAVGRRQLLPIGSSVYSSSPYVRRHQPHVSHAAYLQMPSRTGHRPERNISCARGKRPEGSPGHRGR